MDALLLSFLQSLLRDTVSLGFHYFKAPFSDICAIDQRLRMALQNSQALYNEIYETMKSVEYGFFYEICDKFFLHYILMRPFEDKEDIISVGPFVTRPISDGVLNEIAALNHLNHTSLNAISSYLYQYPLFDCNITPISILVDTLNYINPCASNFKVKEINIFSNLSKDLVYQPIDSYQVCAETVDRRYQTEERLMRSIAAGDVAGATAEGRKFLVKPLEPRIDDRMLDLKAQMYCVNTLFRKAAERSSVHPYFLHQLSTKHVKQREAVVAQYEKMIRGYCYLVKNKSRAGYSMLIRNVLNYIDFHIGEPISLSTLVKCFHYDVNYFTKIFKNHIGCTPSDYRSAM